MFGQLFPVGVIVSLIALSGHSAMANIPSAYFACEGASEQDECQVPGPRFGNCVLDTLCEDPPNTDVNECLLCVDGCWGRPSGGSCRRFDGTMGVCEQQDRCTTDPEKSFNQCNRCVKMPSNGPQGGENTGGMGAGGGPGNGGATTGTSSGGCSAVDPIAIGSWLFVLLAWTWQRRRDLD